MRKAGILAALSLLGAAGPIAAGTHDGPRDAAKAFVPKAFVPTALDQDGNGSPTQQIQDDKQIEKCRAALRKSGPESRQERATAVSDLFGMDDSKAHAVLQEYALPGDDPDGVRRLVLTQLAPKLRSEVDRVFATGPNRHRIRRSYVSSLVRHFDGRPPKNAVWPTLRDLARESIVAIDVGDLDFALGVLLQNGTVELQRQALRAAGESQDMKMVPFLAEYLGSEPLKRVAEEALLNLTYNQFDDEKSCLAWYKENQHRKYVDLAEQAARSTRKAIAQSSKEKNALHIATAVDLIEVLATSTPENKNKWSKWKKIRDVVFATAPTGVFQASLAKLKQVLAAVETAPNGADAKDRLVFFDELVAQLNQNPTKEDHALLLEVASYLCARGEPKAVEQETRLREGLGSKFMVIKLAALHGLRRFPSPTNRAAVMDLVGLARGQKRPGLLVAVAVETLRSPNWQAPSAKDVDQKDWIQGLHLALRDDTLPAGVPEDVIAVFCLSDADGAKLDEVFRLLREEVTQDKNPTKLRDTMMSRLLEFLPLAQGEDRNQKAEQYLDTLLTLLNSKVEIKRRAASYLALPENLTPEQAQKLGVKIARVAGDRLKDEDDDRTFTDLVRVLESLANHEDLVDDVNTRMRTALKKLHGTDGAKKRVESLVDGLLRVAMDKTRDTMEWFRTCESLLALDDRTRILLILRFHLKNTGKKLTDERKDVRHGVYKLVIRNAALRPADQPWTATQNDKDEAKWVLEAFEVLTDAGKATLDTAKHRLTLLRCLAIAGAPQTLEPRAKLWLDANDRVLQGRDRDEARLILARGMLQQSKFREAWDQLQSVDLSGPLAGRRLELTADIAAAMVKKDAKYAETLWREVVKGTKPDDDLYWSRFSQYLLVQLQNNPKKSADLLSQLEAWAKSHADLASKVKIDLDKVRARLRGSAKPPK